jgi:pyrimidine-nucleoside phosphorylase
MVPGRRATLRAVPGISYTCPFMRAVDIIVRKREGQALTRPEIDFVITGVIGGDIPDYQLSALLMAIFLRGLTSDETAWLTEAMAGSGRRIDLTFLPGTKVGKHSTGGVGDKTSIVVVPIVAACGVTVLKSSGRGLGHTGGTLDKLESIPGFNIAPDRATVQSMLGDLQCVFVGQSPDLAPADKKLYALRDVTGTIESMPLIASSIMSKKIAEGTDALVLDVKVGAGAFMKTLPDARALAERMIAIGQHVGLRTEAILTSMDAPLGRSIGNALEIQECIDTLKGSGPPDLQALCLAIAGRMLRLGGAAGSLEAAQTMARDALTSGRALERFREVVERQGGDPHIVDDSSVLPRARSVETVVTERAGFIREMRADAVGTASVLLGSGRDHVDAAIDGGAGIVLRARRGDRVAVGEPIADLHVGAHGRAAEARATFAEALVIDDEPPPDQPLILEVVH